MSAKEFVKAQAGRGGICVPGGGERGDGLCVGVEDVGWCGGEDGESGAAGGAEPCGDGERTVCGGVEDDQVATRVGEAIEVCGDASKAVAPVRRVVVFDEEECPVGIAGDAGDAEFWSRVGETECGEWAGGEAMGCGRESQCVRERDAPAYGVRVGEERVGCARGEHGATVASGG